VRCIELHLSRAARCFMAPFLLIVSSRILDANPVLAAHDAEPVGYAIGPRKGTDSKPRSKLAFLSEPDVVRKILLHLGLPADLPPTPPAQHHHEPFFADDFFQTGAPARSPP